jgi:hypothetical protein
MKLCLRIFGVILVLGIIFTAFVAPKFVAAKGGGDKILLEYNFVVNDTKNYIETSEVTNTTTFSSSSAVVSTTIETERHYSEKVVSISNGTATIDGDFSRIVVSELVENTDPNAPDVEYDYDSDTDDNLALDHPFKYCEVLFDEGYQLQRSGAGNIPSDDTYQTLKDAEVLGGSLDDYDLYKTNTTCRANWNLFFPSYEVEESDEWTGNFAVWEGGTTGSSKNISIDLQLVSLETLLGYPVAKISYTYSSSPFTYTKQYNEEDASSTSTYSDQLSGYLWFNYEDGFLVKSQQTQTTNVTTNATINDVNYTIYSAVSSTRTETID